MDAPWEWAHGCANLRDGKCYVVALVNNGLPIPEDADHLRATMWWPEPNLEDGGASGADITFTLRPHCGNGLEATDASSDTRKMVYLDSNVGKSCYSLVVDVISAPPNPWRNGEKDRLVCWAYYYEDLAHDDPDGPKPDIQ